MEQISQLFTSKKDVPLSYVDAGKFGTTLAPFTGGWLTIEQLILLLYPTFLIPAVWLWIRNQKRQRAWAESPRGCRRIGVYDLATSNLRDEYDDGKASTNANSEQWKVKALFIYPIKSCAPVELASAHVDATGMRYDRQFAFAEFLHPQTRIDALEEEKRPRWTFRTQRDPKYQKLALVRPEVWVPDDSNTSHGWLVVRYPNEHCGAPAWLYRLAQHVGLISTDLNFKVPLRPPKQHTYPKENVVIWRNEMSWINYGVHLPHDFTVYIGTDKPLTLFGVDAETPRNVYRCAPREEELGYQANTGFADAYPLHLLNNASVRDVADRVRDDIPKFSSRRYRSNILIMGPRAYDEDDWKKVRIGQHVLYCSCHTVRCRLPNVDPDTAVKHEVEPDKTLKSYRCIDEGDPKNACLGLQLVPSKETGIFLAVGDRVEVLERGEHFYVKQ